MDRTRQFYQRLLQGHKPSQAKQDEIITASHNLKNVLEHPGYKLIDKFMTTQKEGSAQYLTNETRNINFFSLPWLFNTFLKYLGVMFEQRAYDRIRNYITITIQKGEEYERQRAKTAERETVQGK